MTTSNDTTPMKTCTKCGRLLPATRVYFHQASRAKDGLRDQCKECRKAFGEAHRAEQHAYYIAHREEHRAWSVNYRATERGKEIYRLAEARRRARKLQGGGSFTPLELDNIIKAHTNSKGQLICALCGKPIKGIYHLDHFIPLSKGGTNEAGNIRVMHGKCNQGKGSIHPHKLGILI